jgi:O-phospho-L-seryl-tRNASec:L-selenocysteinyl-tRNA synthase
LLEVGRSGDVTANQPKAAGSSLLLQLARYLTVSALHELSYDFVSSVLLLPLATGMSLSMAFLSLSEQRPSRKYVLWSRIDQKTCLKAILTANLIPICIEL